MQAVEPNPFAPPEETSAPPRARRDAFRSRRLRLIFSFHIGFVLMGYLVAQHEAFFFSGGRGYEFLFLAPFAAAFFMCPLAVIATVISASQYSVPKKLAIVAIDLDLCVLQFVSLLPLV